MTAPRPIVSPDDQKVTFVELFFDLVFVFSVTQIVALLHGHVDVRSAGGALLVFWLVWWSWTQFTWALNAANTDHPRVQMVTLIATGIAFFLAVGIPRALGDGAMWFAAPYAAVRVVGLLLYYWVAWGDVDQRRAVRVFGLLSLGGLAAVLAGATLGGAALYWCWAGAILLDLVAAGVGGQQEGWNLHPDHFVERHGLIVIIALGETLIVAAAGLADAPAASSAIVTALSAVAVTGGLWWSYFHYPRAAFEHELAACSGNARSRMARDVFSVMHFPMLCGIVAMAVATEVALGAPDRPLGLDVRAALGVGAALFVTGTAAAIGRATGRVPIARILLSLAAAGAVTLVATPWLALATVFSMLVAVSALEHRRAESSNLRTLERSDLRTLEPSNPRTFEPSNPRTVEPSNRRTLEPSNFFMSEALALADEAAARAEVPIGAVVVHEGRIVGRGFNQPISSSDPTAHAEIVALREAARTMGNYRLAGVTLYVTVEPCLMCVGAMTHARVGTLVYGAPEPKTGAIESAARARGAPVATPAFVVVSGVEAAAAAARLRRFFQERRQPAGPEPGGAAPAG